MSSTNEYRTRRNTQYPAADGVSSHYSYQPSTLLLCALIFATALCAACDFINGPLTVIFSVTTYAPTIHFATQGIVRNVFQSKLFDRDTVKASYRAIFLAFIWCLSSGVHYHVWSSRAARMTGDFLVTVVPGIQSALFVAFIAIRTTWDARIIKYTDKVELQGEENNPISDAAVPHASPFSEEDNVLSSPESVPISYMVSVNRPSYMISRALLLSSVALTAWTAISDLIITEKDKEGKEIVHIFLVLAFIPTSLLHLYLMIRGPARTFSEAVMIGSVSLDLVPLWIGSQIVQARYIHFSDQAIWHAALVSSIFETLVVGYIALQYGAAVLAEWRSIRMLYGETSIAPSDIDSEYNPQMSPTDITPSELPTFYQPSVVTLVAYTCAAITCSVVESSADLAYGTLMSLLVYIPTIFACAMSALRRQEGVDCGLGNRCTAAEKEPERFVHVGLLWAFTQAFYVLLVPPIQGKGADAEPYLRWATVALGIYVSARYIWDHYHQASTANLTAEEPRAQHNTPSAMYNEDLYTHRTEEGRHLSGPCMMRPWI